MSADFLGPREVRTADTIWHVPPSSDPFGAPTSGAGTIEWQDFGVSASGRDAIHCVWNAAGAGNTVRSIAPAIRNGLLVARGSMIHVRFLLKGASIASGWKPSLSIEGLSVYGGGSIGYNTFDVLNASHTGTFDWIEVNYSAAVNSDYSLSDMKIIVNTDGAKSGECWITGIRVTVQEPADVLRPDAGAPFAQDFLAGLRGVHMHPNPSRKDFFDLGGDYKANLVRFQINTWSGESPALTDPTNMSQWDAWFAAKLLRIQDAIIWARQNDIKIIVAMIKMPGGDGSFTTNVVPYDSVYLNKYLDSWRQIAATCLGAPEVVAFDPMNEPAYLFRTRPQGPGHSFRSAQIQAIDAIREIDPDRWCIYSVTGFDDPVRFKYLIPLDRDKVAYQFHFYRPGQYTVEENTTLGYPGLQISGRTERRNGIQELTNATVDKAFLRDAMDAVRDFQLAHRLPVYMGEFSAPRWAPGVADFLMDVSDIAEEYGWPWTYHAFREANMWDVEYAALPANQGGGVPAVGITDRGQVLRDKFALNASPYLPTEQAPIAPTGVSVADVWSTESRVSWAPARCLVGSWIVEHRPVGGSWTQSTVARDQTTKLITGLTVGVTYEYRVALVNPYGQAVSAVVSAAKGAAYLLDGVSATPAYAYSADRLRTAYSGPVMRVRRSSDNAEQDIGTVNGAFDEAALLAFVGAGDGFVRTIYDQSGNLRHLQQATQARQPRIAASGAVDKIAAKAAANLIAASSHWMSGAFAPLYAAGAATLVGVVRNNASLADSYLFGESSSTLFNPFYDLTSGSPQSNEIKLAIRNDAGATISGNGSNVQVQNFTNGQVRAFRVVDTGSSVRVASNAAAETQDATYTRAGSTLSADQTALGARLRQASADKFPSMGVAQLVAFPSVLSDADEAAILAHQIRWYAL